MKTFRILRNIGITLFSILICLNFTSCSNDNDSGIVAKGKKLTKIVKGDWYIATLNYDNKGRLIEAYTDSRSYLYVWEDSIINVINTSGSIYTLYIKNGLVKTIDEDETLFYNNSKKLITYKGNYNTLSCFWEKDKLSSSKNSDRYNGFTVTFDYDGISCPKGCFHPFFLTLYGDDSGWLSDSEIRLLAYAHPELFGIQTTLLPATSNDDGYYYQYQYEFDRNGYVSKIIQQDEYSDDTYTLTWE